MNQYKPLLSAAPEHSILNAQAFQYTNSAETDIRETFARIRRERENAAVVVDIASRVRGVRGKPCDTSSQQRRAAPSTAR